MHYAMRKVETANRRMQGKAGEEKRLKLKGQKKGDPFMFDGVESGNRLASMGPGSWVLFELVWTEGSSAFLFLSWWLVASGRRAISGRE
ncbi:hypothetical protein Mapa_003468 [Marchantia paleacea]|nr:hypothetical protein Mapa_003468 [Marchantia paleacea]